MPPMISKMDSQNGKNTATDIHGSAGTVGLPQEIITRNASDGQEMNTTEMIGSTTNIIQQPKHSSSNPPVAAEGGVGTENASVDLK